MNRATVPIFWHSANVSGPLNSDALSFIADHPFTFVTLEKSTMLNYSLPNSSGGEAKVIKQAEKKYYEKLTKDEGGREKIAEKNRVFSVKREFRKEKKVEVRQKAVQQIQASLGTASAATRSWATRFWTCNERSWRRPWTTAATSRSPRTWCTSR